MLHVVTPSGSSPSAVASGAVLSEVVDDGSSPPRNDTPTSAATTTITAPMGP